MATVVCCPLSVRCILLYTVSCQQIQCNLRFVCLFKPLDKQLTVAKQQTVDVERTPECTQEDFEAAAAIAALEQVFPDAETR